MSEEKAKSGGILKGVLGGAKKAETAAKTTAATTAANAKTAATATAANAKTTAATAAKSATTAAAAAAAAKTARPATAAAASAKATASAAAAKTTATAAKPAAAAAKPAAATAKPATAAAAKPRFSDVPAGASYAEAAAWAVDQNIIAVSGNQFMPDAACTRGQAATFLWRAQGSPAPKAAASLFTDVTSASPFYQPVLWAVENGITTGVSDTEFAPGGTCTNGQVLTFLWRAAGKPAVVGTSAAAAKLPADSYYKDAVAWADTKKLLAGMADFSPDANCTRANAVTWLYRCYKK